MGTSLIKTARNACQRVQVHCIFHKRLYAYTYTILQAEGSHEVYIFIFDVEHRPIGLAKTDIHNPRERKREGFNRRGYKS